MEDTHQEEAAPIRLTIVPVAHISKKSARLVQQTIESERPALVGVELCRERLAGLVNKRNRNVDVKMLITHPTSGILFVAQQVLGKWWNIKPGGEMMTAFRSAGEAGIPFALLDKPIRTITRDIEKIPLKEKIGIILSGDLIQLPKKATLNDLMKPEVLVTLLNKMKKQFPVSYEVFVDSRNRYMFRNLLLHKPKSAVMIVGAAHVPGITELAKQSEQKVIVSIVGA